MIKINLLFDIAKLYKTDTDGAYRNGVFWVTYNLLKNFLKDDRFKITLYSEFVYPKNNFDTVDIDITTLDYTASKYSIQMSKTAKTIPNKNFIPEQYDAYFNSAFFSKLEDNSIEQFYLLHDAIPLVLKDLYPEKFVNNFESFYKKLYSSTNCFCISKSCQNDFLKYFSQLKSENMTVVYNAPSQKFTQMQDKTKFKEVKNKYKLPLRDDDKYIFTISNLADVKKNLVFTIRNFMEFIDSNNIKDLYFILAGYGKSVLVKELHQNCSELYDKYKNKILFLGYLQDKDVNLFYSNALFFSFISLYEGFGLPLIEAMNAGTPVLTANTSSIPEVVDDCALMISPNDYKDCQNKMKQLYFDRELRENLIEKALKRGRNFSWEWTYKLISDKIYQNVMIKERTNDNN